MQRQCQVQTGALVWRRSSIGCLGSGASFCTKASVLVKCRCCKASRRGRCDSWVGRQEGNDRVCRKCAHTWPLCRASNPYLVPGATQTGGQNLIFKDRQEPIIRDGLSEVQELGTAKLEVSAPHWSTVLPSPAGKAGSGAKDARLSRKASASETVWAPLYCSSLPPNYVTAPGSQPLARLKNLERQIMQNDDGGRDF